MAANTQTFRFKRTVNVPPGEVYHAFTNPTAWRDWFCNAAQADARQGGRIYLWWNSGHYVCGEYTALEPDKKIAFTWDGRGEPEPTRVQVSLAAKNGVTQVTVTHSGVGSGAKWAKTLNGITHGWPEGLENLQSILETGIDLRIARLPRLGLMIDDFNAEIAARLGVPADRGIRIAGTFEATGARAAGLQKDDVMIKLGGKKAVDFPSLADALEGHRAGDVVPVVLYRGGEKMTVPLELSRRSIPELPPTAKELAEAGRKVADALHAELSKSVEGVSDVEASYRPAPNEWNIKELLAHFVACERDLQSWIAELLNGGNHAGEVQDSLEFRPNVTVRLQAIVGRYPTVAGLLEELKRSQAETLSIVAALPAEFVARKPLYRRLADWITEYIHLEEHRDQIRATLDSAKRK
ncbi:MAG: SRPBCC domain-containing protein [Chloroflexi bacterium]|nr:SRPBCC domain-containing protein [Chloroflexota bacterium]